MTKAKDCKEGEITAEQATAAAKAAWDADMLPPPPEIFDDIRKQCRHGRNWLPCFLNKKQQRYMISLGYEWDETYIQQLKWKAPYENPERDAPGM